MSDDRFVMPELPVTLPRGYPLDLSAVEEIRPFPVAELQHDASAALAAMPADKHMGLVIYANGKEVRGAWMARAEKGKWTYAGYADVSKKWQDKSWGARVALIAYR